MSWHRSIKTWRRRRVKSLNGHFNTAVVMARIPCESELAAPRCRRNRVPTLRMATLLGGHTVGSILFRLVKPPRDSSLTQVSTSGGSPSAGNLLDDIKFGNSPCLTADKSVINISGNSPVRVGDTLEYKVDVTNSGGSDAPLSVLTDQIPTGTTYVPGSLKITAGTGIGNLTDAAGDDRGEYNASQDQVTVRLGNAATASAGGILAPGAKATITFRVTANADSAASTVRNTASVSYQDPLDNNAAKTSYSNTVTTPVASAADLQITKEQVTQYPLTVSRSNTD